MGPAGLHNDGAYMPAYPFDQHPLRPADEQEGFNLPSEP